MIEVDIHLHTDSACSTLDVEQLAEILRHAGRPIVTATDHGSIAACRRLRELLPDCLVVTGMEVRSPEGDFLLFSSDDAYLESLPDNIDTVRDLRRDEQTAIIWAHPRVSQRARGWDAPKLPDVKKVCPNVDGLEVLNGTMLTLFKEGVLRKDYFRNLVQIAINYSLAMTGGSDAHEEPLALKAGTLFPQDVHDVASFIQAIKERRVSPVYDRSFFEINLSLSG